MARVSFTFKQTASVSLGSNLQGFSGSGYPVSGDNDTALRADGYVTAPSSSFSSTGYFAGYPDSYSSVKLSWGVGGSLTDVSNITVTPSVTTLILVYNALGFPQTIADGTQINQVTTPNGTITHSGLSSGSWAYYSLFAKYESSSTRSWYEKVASIEVLVPTNYKSTDDLWKRIPQTYRLQDASTTQQQIPGEVSLSGDPALSGQLRRALNIVGWDIDRLRTLIDFQMTAKDPSKSSSEVLNAVAKELGVPLDINDLGPIRLRNLVNNVRLSNTTKGTLFGVETVLTALTGSLIEITPSRPENLSLSQRSFASGWTVTTGASASTAASVYTVTSTTAASSTVVIARTPVTISQAAQYRSYYDVTPVTGASVLGAMISLTPTAASVFTLSSSFFPTSSPSNFKHQPSSNRPWYQAPLDHGIVGDGSFTNVSAYLEIVLVLGTTGSSINLENPSLIPLVNYPYNIDVYNQRTNLIKDPTFYYPLTNISTAGSVNYWNYYVSGGTGASTSASANSSALVITNTGASTTAASVTVNTNVTGQLTPIRTGVSYVFSTIDTSRSVVSVSIVSQKYGTISTSTSPYTEKKYASDTRRYWELLRTYSDPWLPLNMTDCYLSLVLASTGGTTVRITQPLFEAYNKGGEYFDGSFTNGGWLKGSASSGTYDYRWQNASQYGNFSWYTPDYGKTVSTVQRLVRYYVPVTESGASATLRFDRILGQ